jgi:hypothetical protein
MEIKRSNWLLAALAGGWLLIVATLAIFFTPDDAERVREGYGKVAMMWAVMSAVSWLSARPAVRSAL